MPSSPRGSGARCSRARSFATRRREDVDEAGLAAGSRRCSKTTRERDRSSDFHPEYRDAVAADRDGSLRSGTARRLSDGEGSEARGCWSSSRGVSGREGRRFRDLRRDGRYLDEHLPERIGGRERVVVIGDETSPDERTRGARLASHRTPSSSPTTSPLTGEVDLLLSTDVLSEGQNLQQAQAVISYDMPWNPQRVVQRNGRVIRLRAPTMRSS